MLMLLYAGRWLVRRLVWVSQNRGICSDILEITERKKLIHSIFYNLLVCTTFVQELQKCSTSKVLWYFSLLVSSWTVDSISLESVLSTHQSLFVHHRLNVCRSHFNSDLQLQGKAQFGFIFACCFFYMCECIFRMFSLVFVEFNCICLWSKMFRLSLVYFVFQFTINFVILKVFIVLFDVEFVSLYKLEHQDNLKSIPISNLKRAF